MTEGGLAWRGGCWRKVARGDGHRQAGATTVSHEDVQKACSLLSHGDARARATRPIALPMSTTSVMSLSIPGLTLSAATPGPAEGVPSAHAGGTDAGAQAPAQ